MSDTQKALERAIHLIHEESGGDGKKFVDLLKEVTGSIDEHAENIIQQTKYDQLSEEQQKLVRQQYHIQRKYAEQSGSIYQQAELFADMRKSGTPLDIFEDKDADS